MTQKVFVFRLEGTPEDHENFGTWFATIPATMETINFLVENGEQVVRLRDANILPEKFSSMGVEMDAKVWWDSPNADYDMEEQARLDFMDKLENEVLDHHVCLVSEQTLHFALRCEQLPAVARFYISGDSFSVTAVLPIDSRLTMSGLLTRAAFADCIARTHDVKDLEEAGLR